MKARIFLEPDLHTLEVKFNQWLNGADYIDQCDYPIEIISENMERVVNMIHKSSSCLIVLYEIKPKGAT